MMLTTPDATATVQSTLLSALPQLLSALGGGAIGLVAAWATNHAAIKRMQLQFAEDRSTRAEENFRDHADELYTMFTTWSKMLTSHYLLAANAWTGKIDYNALMDSREKAMDAVRDKYEFERIEMLVQAYFPHLEAQFKPVLSARDVLAVRDARLRRAYLDGTFQPQTADPMLAELGRFNDASDGLKGCHRRDQKHTISSRRVAVRFQEVVHSNQTEEAESASNQILLGRNEWTFTRMPD